MKPYERLDLNSTLLHSMLTVGLVLLALTAGFQHNAQAVPSFSRQTGMACNACHSNPPELTAFGRQFKLEGYTLVDKKPETTIEDDDLLINRNFPLSVMLLLSETAINTREPGASGTNAEFPQALSLFFASAISTHIGAMAQATYSHQSDHFSMDNTDVRFADHTAIGSTDLLYSFTLNNSPTVEDVWNSTPSWGYPWIAPNSTPTPAAKPIIAGTLAQDVAGLGAYTLWGDHLYAGATLYTSEHAGGPQPANGADYPFNISGVAPYWRLAWQQAWSSDYIEIGTYGIYASIVPAGISGTSDTYTDPSFDFQYERTLGTDMLTVHGTYIHETANLDGTLAATGANTSSHTMNMARGDATYHLHNKYTLTLSGFSITGTGDPVLYAPAAVTGSAQGSPDSGGLIAQLGFWPEQNIELSAAYTAYTKFNGASSNYDGSSRDASANNSVYVACWFNF